MSKKTSNPGGGYRATSGNYNLFFDKERTATDVDVDKYGNVINITDHQKDGSSHSHNVIHHSPLVGGGYSKGNQKK